MTGREDHVSALSPAIGRLDAQGQSCILDSMQKVLRVRDLTPADLELVLGVAASDQAARDADIWQHLIDDTRLPGWLRDRCRRARDLRS